MMPARHLLELIALPEIARATAVLTFFLRCPGAPVSSEPYMPPAIKRPPTSFARLNAPTGIELIRVARSPILLTLALSTLTLFGPPSDASTPRSLAEKEIARSSS